MFRLRFAAVTLATFALLALAFASAPALLLIAALLGCLVPAWRKAAVEPTEALRCE